MRWQPRHAFSVIVYFRAATSFCCHTPISRLPPAVATARYYYAAICRHVTLFVDCLCLMAAGAVRRAVAAVADDATPAPYVAMPLFSTCRFAADTRRYAYFRAMSLMLPLFIYRRRLLRRHAVIAGLLLRCLRCLMLLPSPAMLMLFRSMLRCRLSPLCHITPC